MEPEEYILVLSAAGAIIAAITIIILIFV